MSVSADTVRQFDLSLQHVNLVFDSSRGPVHALNEVSFLVKAGEFVSVLGPSGCGKSSLLRVITGLIAPTSGEVMLGAVPIVAPSAKVGVVFQQPALMPWMTVLNNVMTPARNQGLDRKIYRERALSLLRLTGLESFSNHYPRELSGGMRQRASIARGLLHDPELLVMDEPFAALDAMTRDRMMEELHRIWHATGKSVFFITHSIPEAVFLSNRILVLSPRPGTVIEDIEVDLPKVRTLDLLDSAQFLTQVSRLRGIFKNMAV